MAWASRCRPGTYEASVPTPSSDRACVPVMPACPAGAVDQAPPTYSMDRSCRACGPDGTYHNGAACAPCPPGTWQNASYATSCRNQTVACLSGREYEAAAATRSGERECRRYRAACDAAAEWQAQDPTPTSDRVCAPATTEEVQVARGSAGISKASGVAAAAGAACGILLLVIIVAMVVARRRRQQRVSDYRMDADGDVGGLQLTSMGLPGAATVSLPIRATETLPSETTMSSKVATANAASARGWCRPFCTTNLPRPEPVMMRSTRCRLRR